MKKITIIGFGRFGELLAGLAGSTFEVSIIESDTARQKRAASLGYQLTGMGDTRSADIIFLAVPISLFEQTVKDLAPHIGPQQMVVDLCSVKTIPARIMAEHLPESRTIATHPMFGPDSAKLGLQGLQVAVCQGTASNSDVQVITDFWESHGCSIIRTTPEAHDKDTAYSQAFTYTIAKIILNTRIPDVTLQTRSFKAINKVARLSANDTDQLFHDMLYYNPYFADMKKHLESSLEETRSRLDEIEEEQANDRLI